VSAFSFVQKQADSRRLVLFWALMLSLCSVAFAAKATAPADLAERERLWALLAKGGYVVMIRHAATLPGIGDPPQFSFTDCSTQRNLSDPGRDEARRLGEEFKRRKIPIARVLSSPWCRCVDTAKLAFGQAEVWEPLSSSFRLSDKSASMAEIVKRRISRYGAQRATAGEPRGNLVMVTHQFNINDVTGRSVGMGEMVVARPDGCCGLKVLGVLPAL
jgi:phosphohistidine phosphatase SixA